MDMKRDGFVFYRSFYEAIKDLPRDVQLELFHAIMEYGLNGEETEGLKPMARSFMTLIKPVLSRDRNLYENGCKGGFYGKLGGRPKTEENPKKTPRKPLLKEEDVRCKMNETFKEKGNTGVLPQKKKTDACPAVVKSEKIGYAENVSLTNAEYEALTERYGKEAADAMIEILDNYKGANGRRYKSDYRAILSWVVKRYNEDIQDEFRHHGQHRNNNNGGRGMFTREQCDAVLRAADVLGDAEADGEQRA